MGVQTIKTYLVVFALGSLLLTACSGGDKEEPNAPFKDYKVSDKESAFDAEGPAPQTEEVSEEEPDDFLTEPTKDDQVLADATVDEPEPAVDPATGQTEQAEQAEVDPLADLLGGSPEPTSTGETPPVQPQAPAAAVPPSAKEPVDGDSLFADAPPTETPATAPAPHVAGRPVDGDGAAAPVAELQPPVAGGEFDELFGDEPQPKIAKPAEPADTAVVEQETRTVMQEFIAAMRSGDIDSAYQYVLTPSDAATQELVRKQIAKMAEMLIEGTLQTEIVHVRIQDDWALLVARLTITDSAGQPSERLSEQYMVKYDGKWKVAPETTRSDPAVQPLVDQDFDALVSWYQQHKPELEQQ